MPWPPCPGSEYSTRLVPFEPKEIGNGVDKLSYNCKDSMSAQVNSHAFTFSLAVSNVKGGKGGRASGSATVPLLK